MTPKKAVNPLHLKPRRKSSWRRVVDAMRGRAPILGKKAQRTTEGGVSEEEKSD